VVSAAVPIPVIQLLQVLTVAAGAPWVTGIIAKVEARLQGRRGPRVLQPYYDLGKLLRKEALAPEGASWFFLAAPVIAVAAYLTIPLLIPVLTTFGLPLGYMGDILGGGFLLALASFVVAVAALETGSPYAQLGSSRAKTFSAITEPVVLFVVFTVALLTGTDLPYALAATVRSSAGEVVRPGHLLASAALFMVILHETGRIPVETHTGTNEFGMIEEARSFEHSGPFLALLRWASELKQFILFTLLADVFVVPWGLASTQHLGAVLLAIVALLAKAAAIGVVVAVIDNSFAKLRLFKITEYVSAAFLLAVIGVFTLYLGGGA
jgi:formate hydrogenlyase subunit 4